MPPKRNNTSNEKPQNFKKSLIRLLKDFKSEIGIIIVVIILAIASAILQIYATIYMKDIMDMQNNGMLEIDLTLNQIKMNWGVFFKGFGFLMLLYIGSSAVSFTSQLLAAKLSADYAYKMRNKVQRKIPLLPLSYFDKVPYGDTLSIGTNDVDNISRNLTSIITQVFTSVTLFLGTAVAMIVVKWQLALVAFATLPLTIALILVISKFSGRQFVNYRKQLGKLNGEIEEDYAGYKIIKLFGKEDTTIKKFEHENEKLAKYDYLSQFLSGFIMPSTIFVNNLGYVAVAVVGGVINDPVSMLVFFLFLRMFSQPFQQIGNIFNIIQSVVASAERIYALIDEEELKEDGYYIEPQLIDSKELNVKEDNKVLTNLFSDIKDLDTLDYDYYVDILDKNNNVIATNVKDNYTFEKEDTYIINRYKKQKLILDEERIKGNFEFKDVKFSYTPEKPLIDEFSLKIHKGDIVAIVGPTGAGKTTIVNLIMRFYDINSGEIILDGHKTTDYSYDTLRGSIGMVLQDTWLFKGTIRENLLYGDQNATDEEVEKACREAHVWHFIKTLPGGLDFVLNEDGTNVSQGQRQLLTIARAIISKPKILILDEATSSVDTRTEAQIQDALDRIMKDRTSFVIAHRLSTIKNAKMIIVMKKGHIIETGTHKELLKKGGFYADLYNSQFSSVNPMAQQENEVLES